MKRLLLIFFLLILSMSVAAADQYKFVKELHVAVGDIFGSNIVSIDGDIKILGEAADSIIILGGRIEITGEIKGDVICIASNVFIHKNAKIGGDLIVLGDAPKRHEGTVAGKYHLFELDLKKIKEVILPILTGSNSFFILNLIKTVLWFILVLVVFAIFNRKVYAANNILQRYPKKLAWFSIIGILAFILLLILFVLLSFLIIGIPFLLSLFVFYFIILTFGRTVLLFFIGKRITLLMKLDNIPPILYLFFGFLLYVLLLFIPYAGRILLLGLNIVEFGIGLSYLFRKRFKLNLD